MSALPNSPFESFDEAAHLHMRVAQALCAVVESLAMAGQIRQARRAMAAVQKIIDRTAQLSVLSEDADASDLQSCLRELRHRARNAETVLKLIE